MTASGSGIGRSSITCKSESIIRRNPLPPASTTPALAKTGKSSGVESKERLAASRAISATGNRLDSSDTAFSAASAVSLTTVRMVPSTGFPTAS